jgi:hypothetical protein
MTTKSQSETSFYNLSQKKIHQLLFALTILSIPFFQIYYHGIILSDLFLFLTIIPLLLGISILGKTYFPVWPRINLILLFLLLYIPIIGLGGFHIQNNNFILQYIQHGYAPFYSMALLFAGYALYGDNFLSKIFKYIAYIGLFVALINFFFLLNNLVNIIEDDVLLLAYSDTGKLYFPFNRSSQLAEFLISTFPIVIGNVAWDKKASHARWMFLLLISYLFIVVALGTGSRTGAALICSEVVAMCILGLWLSQWKKKAYGIVTILLLIYPGYILAIFIAEQKFAFTRAISGFSYALSGDSIFVPRGREQIYDTLIFLSRENPIIGAGLSACKSFAGKETHNIYLGALAETGIGGTFLIIGAFLVLPIVYAYKVFSIIRKKKLLIMHYPLMVALFGQSVAGIFHYELRVRWVWLLIFMGLEAIYQLSDYRYSKREQTSLMNVNSD